MSVVVFRNAMMASLVERKGWLIDELQHAMGQPLQALRSWSDQLISSMISNREIDNTSIIEFRKTQNQCFKLVHESRAQLAIYAKMTQPIDKTELNNVFLYRIIKESIHFLTPEASRKGCYITHNLIRVRSFLGYEALLRASIINLIDNAIKYSYERREIIVNLNENKNGCISLSVENYGVGIPEADLPRIFEPYFRSKVPDDKGARKGCGIGLAIVKHAIEIVHGGNIAVESQPPKKLPPDFSTNEISKLPHKTTFNIYLYRNILDNLNSIA